MRKCGDGGGRSLSWVVRVDGPRVAPTRAARDCVSAAWWTSAITARRAPRTASQSGVPGATAREFTVGGRTSEPMRRCSRREGDARAHGGAVNIAGSVIAGVDQVPAIGSSGAAPRAASSSAPATITSEVNGCQPREGWPIERPCLRLFARFHEGRTAYRKLPRRCSWDPKLRAPRHRRDAAEPGTQLDVSAGTCPDPSRSAAASGEPASSPSPGRGGGG
jgi:hypothetical protein